MGRIDMHLGAATDESEAPNRLSTLGDMRMLGSGVVIARRYGS